MKKVYMPTIDELYCMQDMGFNLYKYLLVKAVESLIMDTKVYKSEDRSILQGTYKYLKEHPDIACAICKLYPEEIKYSTYAQNESLLCCELINPKYNQDKSIYNLDNLSYFEEGHGVLRHQLVLSSTIQTLAEKLELSPRYRFEYKESTLLNNIFNREISGVEIPRKSVKDFIKVEPAYALTLPKEKLSELTSNQEGIPYVLNMLLDQYSKTYGFEPSNIEDYSKKDILTNPDIEVKRLLRCINQRQIKK